MTSHKKKKQRIVNLDGLTTRLARISDFNEEQIKDFLFGLSLYFEHRSKIGAVFNIWSVVDSECEGKKTLTPGTTAIYSLSHQVKNNNGKISKESFNAFYRALVRPPVVTDFIKFMLNDNVVDKKLKKSDVINSLTKLFFWVVLKLVFEKEKTVSLEGIGTFYVAEGKKGKDGLENPVGPLTYEYSD